MARRRIVSKRPSGIFNRSAPFWQGDTAEEVLEARLAEREKVKASKRRASGRSAKAPRSPEAQLRRLERQLKKRKTEEGRRRVRERIAELKKELGR